MLRRSQPKPRNRLPLAILGKLSENIIPKIRELVNICYLCIRLSDRQSL